MKDSKIIIILLFFITVLLGYLAFHNSVKSYFRKRSILSKAAITNFAGYWMYCADPFLETVKVECDDVKKFLLNKMDKFRELVLQKENLNCTDFESNSEASLFYDYISGEDAKYFLKDVYDNKSCFIDPYGLDTDHDCKPCEDYFTSVDEEMIRKQTEQSKLFK